MHRIHHAKVDTKDDPHAPMNSHNPFIFMWHTRCNYINIFLGKTKVEDRYRKDLPDWPAFEKLAHNWFTRTLFILGYTAFYYFFVEAPWMWALLPITITMGPTHGMMINWFSHKYGYRNYKTKDKSTNLLPVDLILIGECYHHNHHAYTARANMAHKWWEFDITYGVLKVLSWFGIVRLRSSKTKNSESVQSTEHLAAQ